MRGLSVIFLLSLLSCERSFVSPGLRRTHPLLKNSTRQSNYCYSDCSKLDDELSSACSSACSNAAELCEEGTTSCEANKPSYTDVTDEQWKTICGTLCSSTDATCPKKCEDAKYTEEPWDELCMEACQYSDNSIDCKTEYPDIAEEYEGIKFADFAAMCDKVTPAVSVSGDTEKCFDRCEKKFDDGYSRYFCQSTCADLKGKCPYDGNGDCKDGYEKPFPKTYFEDDEKSRRSTKKNEKEDITPKDAGYAKDDWEKMCNAVCPKSSLWWVGLVVGLVVVIAVVVVLIVICFVKKLLCFKASS